jgi:cellulose synthase/poly-beta-1,6-N-acetylglucosamine synthase-like glycosyltransferase
MTLLFAILGLVLLVLATHPFTTYPASLWLAARLRPATNRRPAVSAPPVSFSLCSCAHNEEGAARALVENRLRVIEGRKAEILIYDDDSMDGTAKILTPYADRIRLVRGFERCGKTAGMNQLAAMAEGDILVFSDANVALAEDVLDRLAAHFREPEVGCVCGHLIYVNGEESATAATGAGYWRFEEALKRLETACGSAIGADGSLFAMRRRLHRPVPEHLIDDMYLSLSALTDGARVVQAEDALAFERSASKARDEFRRKARIACQALNAHRALWPRLRQLSAFERYKYISHKWLRWFSPFSSTIGFALILLSLFSSHDLRFLAASIELSFGLLLILLGLNSQLLRLSASLLAAFAGVGLGIIQSFRGMRYQTWTPTASVR